MLLIVYYVIFMIAGDLAAYFIGLTIEYEWGSHASLIVFLALYFLFLWVSWLLAVWVTKPKVATQWSAPLGVDRRDAFQLAICRAWSSSNLTGLLYPSAECRRLAL